MKLKKLKLKNKSVKRLICSLAAGVMLMSGLTVNAVEALYERPIKETDMTQRSAPDNAYSDFLGGLKSYIVYQETHPQNPVGKLTRRTMTVPENENYTAQVLEWACEYDAVGNLIMEATTYSGYYKKSDLEKYYKTPYQSIITYEYDAEGKIIKGTESCTEPGTTTSPITGIYKYDAAGNLIKVTFTKDNPNGIERTLGDGISDINVLNWKGIPNKSYGSMKLSCLQLGAMPYFPATYEYKYDAAGNLIEEKYSTATNSYYGKHFSYQYDVSGNLIKQVYDGGSYYGSVRSCEYDANGNIIKEFSSSSSTPDIPLQEYEYDASGRLIKAIGINQTTTYEYDATGRLVQSRYVNPNFKIRGPIDYTDYYQYDASGRLISISGVNIEYDNFGNVVKITDGRGDTITYEYAY